MARRRSRLVIDIEPDERTKDMSVQALICRKRGHRLDEQAMSRKRYQELITVGLWEEHLECRCGRYRITTWKWRTGEVVEIKDGYKDKNYLMPRGQGRLSRDEARVAWAARQLPQYL